MKKKNDRILTAFKSNKCSFFRGNVTYLKYLLSYVIIVSILIVSFFFIIRSQLADQYFTHRSQQAVIKLNEVSSGIDDELVYLSRVDASLKTNIRIMRETYRTHDAYRYHAHQELLKYASVTKIIQSVVYSTPNENDVLSTYFYVTLSEGVFHINDGNDSFVFDPAPYYNASRGQLIMLYPGNREYLIYFPALSSLSDHVYFYFLDRDEIRNQIKTCLSDEINAVALLDQDGHFIVEGNNTSLVSMNESNGAGSSSVIDNLAAITSNFTDGIYSLNNSTSLCVCRGNRKFSLIALISNDFLNRQINRTFASTYMSLLIIALIGTVLIYLAMHVTYRPLQRLTEEYSDESGSKTDYLKQLNNTFRRAEMRSRELMDKLDHYHLFIQKSLLDSVLIQPGRASDTRNVLPNMDSLFDPDCNNEIFVVKIASPGKLFPCSEIRDYFLTVLPGENACSILEENRESAVFLICYSGNEHNKDEVLKNLLRQLNEENGYLSSISNGTDSPLDIPSLYEDAVRAGSLWPAVPVVACQMHSSDAISYPHRELNQFSTLLKQHAFDEAEQVKDKLFSMIDHYERSDSKLFEFFERCVLIDMLSVIANCLNQFSIPFEDYSDLYYETLYFCRSVPYNEKKEQIFANMQKFLALYREEIINSVNPALIRSVIESSYTDPNFSIAGLADRFHISIAYMSYLVKKELDLNFSDYLWALRQQKAKKLLKDTDMSVDQISLEVGYLNSSSFRRKFKQENGITPSQYRQAE